MEIDFIGNMIAAASPLGVNPVSLLIEYGLVTDEQVAEYVARMAGTIEP